MNRCPECGAFDSSDGGCVHCAKLEARRPDDPERCDRCGAAADLETAVRGGKQYDLCPGCLGVVVRRQAKPTDGGYRRFGRVNARGSGP